MLVRGPSTHPLNVVRPQPDARATQAANRPVDGRTVGFVTDDSFSARATSTPNDFRDKASSESDGHLIGSDGQAFPPGTSPSQVPPTTPAQGGASGTVIWINGQGASPEVTSSDMQQVANATGQNVIGVYNATEGMLQDTLQSVNDKLDRGNNPAIATTSDLVYEQLKDGQDVRLMGHSQGGVIIARALEDVGDRLKADGHSDAEVNALLGKVQVETLGGAASSYPDGPRYTHYINQADFVPRELGLGETNPPLFDLSPKKLGVDTQPGAGATVVQFNEGSLLDRLNPAGSDHSLETYLGHYRTPETVADHPDRVEVAERDWKDTARDVVSVVTNPIGAAFRGIGRLFG